MKEPKPLLNEGASDFERQLLRAVMRERPPPQLRSRMRQALGLTGPLVWASSVKAMLASLVGKGALGVAVAGLVAAGAAGVVTLHAGDGAESTAVSPAPQAITAPAVPEPAPVAEPTSRGDERAPLAAEQNRELREEIQLLDRARAALQNGSGAAALEQLDRYRERFPTGILSREAALLRQRALATPRARSNRSR